MLHYFKEIEFAGFILRDPVTILSNILLSGAGFYSYRCMIQLKKTAQSVSKNIIKGWALFFLFGALAALTGIFVHGFSYYMTASFHLQVWLTMGCLQNISVFFVQFGTAKQYFSLKKWLVFLVFLQFLFFTGLLLIRQEFALTGIHTALGMLPIAGLNFYLFSKKKNHSCLIGSGILFAILPALVVAFKIMPSPWFNYNDIAHLLLIVSLLMICKGVEWNADIHDT